MDRVKAAGAITVILATIAAFGSLAMGHPQWIGSMFSVVGLLALFAVAYLFAPTVVARLPFRRGGRR